MGLLDIFHSEPERRKRHAEKLIQNLKASRTLLGKSADLHAQRCPIIEELDAIIKRRDPSVGQPKGRYATLLDRLERLYPEELIDLEREEDLSDEEYRLMYAILNEHHLKMNSSLRREGCELEAACSCFKHLAIIVKAQLVHIRKMRTEPEHLPDVGDLMHKETEAGMELVRHLRANGALFEEIIRTATDVVRMTEIETFLSEHHQKMWEAEQKAIRKAMGPELPGVFVRLYENVIEKAGAPFSDVEEAMRGIEEIERIIKDDALLGAMLKRLRPKFTDARRDALIKEFRNAWNDLRFDHIDLHT